MTTGTAIAQLRRTTTTLAADGLRVHRAGRWVLDDVSLVARAGGICGVTGPSGSGKTTLLFVLAALIAPDAGIVTLDGEPISANERDYRARSAIVLQTYGLAPALTAEENVAVPLQVRGYDRAEVERRTEEALSTIGLDGLGHHLVEELSGGQQQRVAVARALALRPDVLLADEPTAELDSETRNLVLRLLSEHVSRGGIVVLATHDPEVMAICSSVVELADGRVASPTRLADETIGALEVADDSDDQMFRRPDADVSAEDDDLSGAGPPVPADGAGSGILARPRADLAGSAASLGSAGGMTRPVGGRRIGVTRRSLLAVSAGLLVIGGALTAYFVTRGSPTPPQSGPRGSTGVASDLPRPASLSASALLAVGTSLALSAKRGVVVPTGSPLESIDPATGKAIPLPALVPVGGRTAASITSLLFPYAANLPGGVVVAIAVPDSNGARPPVGTAELLRTGSRTEQALGPASAVFGSASTGTVWLETGIASSGRCTIRAVTSTGSSVLAARPLPCWWKIAGAVSTGLVTFESDSASAPTSLYVWNPAADTNELLIPTSPVQQVVTASTTIALIAGGPCSATCALSVIDTSSAVAKTVTLHPSKGMSFYAGATASFSLSPDGRLVAIEELPPYDEPTGMALTQPSKCAYLQCTQQVTGEIGIFRASDGTLVGERPLSYLSGGTPPLWSPDSAYVFLTSTPQSIGIVPIWSMSAATSNIPLSTRKSTISLGAADFFVLPASNHG